MWIKCRGVSPQGGSLEPECFAGFGNNVLDYFKNFVADFDVDKCR